MALTSEDVLNIYNLVTAYCITTDNADVDGFMNCWVPADEFEGYDSGAFGNMKTWQELKDFETHHVGPGGDANGKRHQSTNVHIEVISDDQVLTTNDMLVFEVAEIPHLVATGRYINSKVVKTNAGWKFKRRELIIDPGFFKLMEKLKQDEKG
ncbi:MAG: nuclear transport factor 2 family protein [Rhizobacter sp.]|nr:nuclear transport factor 2 family protein [Ferruginibacter sp.]